MAELGLEPSSPVPAWVVFMVLGALLAGLGGLLWEEPGALGVVREDGDDDGGEDSHWHKKSLDCSFHTHPLPAPAFSIANSEGDD